MKYTKILALLTTFFLLFSCMDENEISNTYEKSTLVNQNQNHPLNIPVYANDQLIVQYQQGVSALQKMRLRNSFEVMNYKICENCDGLIEKWFFSPDVNLEHKKASIKGDEGAEPEGIINVDNEFTFRFERESNQSHTGSQFPSYDNKIAHNNGIVIAVFDSGINYNFSGFTNPFLYDANRSPQYYPSNSGWNFVSHNSNFYDDYYIQHGTKVSYIINKTLDSLNIPHQILPVKVSGANGKASYFDILCGMCFIDQKADIAQMSLGWYSNSNAPINTIFINKLKEYSNQILFVTSAGNNNSNNDDILHYPSSYPQTNLLAIAAANKSLTKFASFSNFGDNSVDFLAPGENIFFDSSTRISGTSYAAPYVSAIAAKIMYQNGNVPPDQIENFLINYGTPLPTLTGLKNTKYNLLIN